MKATSSNRGEGICFSDAHPIFRHRPALRKRSPLAAIGCQADIGSRKWVFVFR